MQILKPQTPQNACHDDIKKAFKKTKKLTKIQIDQSKHNHPPDHKFKQKKNKTKGLKTKKSIKTQHEKKKILN